MSTPEILKLEKKYRDILFFILQVEKVLKVDLNSGRRRGEHKAGVITGIELTVNLNDFPFNIEFPIILNELDQHNFNNILESFLTFLTDLKELAQSSQKQLEILDPYEQAKRL